MEKVFDEHVYYVICLSSCDFDILKSFLDAKSNSVINYFKFASKRTLSKLLFLTKDAIDAAAQKQPTLKQKLYRLVETTRDKYTVNSDEYVLLEDFFYAQQSDTTNSLVQYVTAMLYSCYLQVTPFTRFVVNRVHILKDSLNRKVFHSNSIKLLEISKKHVTAVHIG